MPSPDFGQIQDEQVLFLYTKIIMCLTFELNLQMESFCVFIESHAITFEFDGNHIHHLFH